MRLLDDMFHLKLKPTKGSVPLMACMETFLKYDLPYFITDKCYYVTSVLMWGSNQDLEHCTYEMANGNGQHIACNGTGWFRKNNRNGNWQCKEWTGEDNHDITGYYGQRQTHRNKKKMASNSIYLHINYVIWYYCWRVLCGFHHSILYSFLIAGHTKFSPDWCFGLLKQSFRQTFVSLCLTSCKLLAARLSRV